MNRPIEIRDVENISLEASDDNSDMYPQLVAQFTCQQEALSDCSNPQATAFIHVCCSVVWLINVTHAAIEGISVTVTTPHVSGVVLQQCSLVHIQSNTYIGIQEQFEIKQSVGIIANESSDIEMDSLEASNFTVGVMLHMSRSTSMMNVSAAHNGWYGIRLDNSTHTSIMNVSAAQNGDFGIWLKTSIDTSMLNVSAVQNGDVGIRLGYSTNTSMMNVSAAHNQNNAIRMSSCINTRLYYSYTYHNGDGIYISGSRKTHILYHNTENTMYIIKSTDTYILNSVFSEHSEIEIRNAANTYLTNTTSLITAYNTTNIVLNDTLFSNMDAPSTASSTSEPTSLPAVISLYSSTLNITDYTFTRNNISSIKAIGSNVTMSGKVLFHNNTASSGTVLISAKNSLLITTDYSNIDFQNNHAINYGGVFFITTEESYQTSMSLKDIIESSQNDYYDNYEVDGSLIISKTECFVLVEGSRSHARLTFINNTAGKGGDVLYGGLVALGYDGDWICLLSFKNISDISQQSGLSLISSAPSRVCLCNETGQPDCLTVADPTTHVIYPGQTITIPAVVVGQDFGTVNGSVFPQFLHTPYTTNSVDMEPRHSIAVEHSQCSDLEYTIFSQSEESAAVLVLTHNSREISHLMNEEDNQEITKSWEIINKEPITTKLWLRILYVTSLTSPIGLSLCNTTLNIKSQTSLVIIQLITSINSQLL